MKIKIFSIVLITAVFTLAGAPTIAGQDDKVDENVKLSLEKLIKAYGNAKVASTFADFGISFPGSAGFRGMQYNDYLLGRSCWTRGPKAGLIRNDNCITYKASCNLGNGGSKVTVTKLNGDKHIQVYDDNREVFVCEATIHLPEEEPKVVGLSPSHPGVAKP